MRTDEPADEKSINNSKSMIFRNTEVKVTSRTSSTNQTGKVISLHSGPQGQLQL